MKRVLIITFDFPPQGGTGAIRVTKFAKYLPEFGWQPIVVCSDTLWNLDESLVRDVPDVPVYRVGWSQWMKTMRPHPPQSPTYATKTSGEVSVSPLKQQLVQVIRRIFVPDINVLWVRNAFQTCMKVLQESPCDAMMTTSPPNSVHLVGYYLHTRLGIPWVADFRDVWTAENPALLRLGKLHVARQRRVERRVLEACDRAVMVTDPLTRQTQQVFGPQIVPKCITITNGFDPEDFSSSPVVLDNDRFVIIYVGTVLGPQVDNAFPQGLRLALEQSEAFREMALVRFVGQLAPDYQAHLNGLEQNVEVFGFVTHGEAVAMMLRAHVLLLVLPNTELARMTFTNKFFEYLAARRPILALVPNGIISDIVMQEKIGAVAPPNNPSVIAQALLTLFKQVRTHPEGHGSAETLLARFDRRELTGKLAAVLDDVTQRE